MSVRDITDPQSQPLLKAVKPSRTEVAVRFSAIDHLEDAGFDRQPRPHLRRSARCESSVTKRRADARIRLARDRRELARTRLTSFGDGHGLWEAGAGKVLPFYTRNLTGVTEWVQPLRRADLMPQIVELQPDFRAVPPGTGTARPLRTKTDAIQSGAIDLSRVLNPSGTGLVWAGLRDGAPIAKSRRLRSTDRSTIVQVTSLGVNVKYSPQNTLVFVTRLDTGEPVPGAHVSLIRRDGAMAWESTTGADGAAVGGAAPRLRRDWYTPELDFIVIAEKDGDLAYAGNTWHEGISPWDFDVYPNPREIDPVLRGSVFTDRGVYRLGEEVHFKAILRSDTPTGVKLLPLVPRSR